MQRRRLFYALWPDPALADRLAQLAAHEDGAPGARVVGRVDLHLTLCFLGAVEEGLLAPLCAGAAAIEARAFDLVFDARRCWRSSGLVAAVAPRPTSAARSLVAGLRGLARDLGLTVEARPWRPHVTLIRGATRGSVAPARRTIEPALVLVARSFHLAASAAVGPVPAAGAGSPRYSILAGWPLT